MGGDSAGASWLALDVPILLSPSAPLNFFSVDYFETLRERMIFRKDHKVVAWPTRGRRYEPVESEKRERTAYLLVTL